tara:strand:+ start:21986 stop:22207 length:222 start_codon:yes stop_codon:yes gene_type:complete
MPGLLIKSVPPDLHLKLKQSASQHHRSMTKEALALLEKALEQEPTPAELPQPVRLKSPISGKWINGAKRRGRE